MERTEAHSAAAETEYNPPVEAEQEQNLVLKLITNNIDFREKCVDDFDGTGQAITYLAILLNQYYRNLSLLLPQLNDVNREETLAPVVEAFNNSMDHLMRAMNSYCSPEFSIEPNIAFLKSVTMRLCTGNGRLFPHSQELGIQMQATHPSIRVVYYSFLFAESFRANDTQNSKMISFLILHEIPALAYPDTLSIQLNPVWELVPVHVLGNMTDVRLATDLDEEKPSLNSPKHPFITHLLESNVYRQNELDASYTSLSRSMNMMLKSLISTTAEKSPNAAEKSPLTTSSMEQQLPTLLHLITCIHCADEDSTPHRGISAEIFAILKDENSKAFLNTSDLLSEFVQPLIIGLQAEFSPDKTFRELLLELDFLLLSLGGDFITTQGLLRTINHPKFAKTVQMDNLQALCRAANRLDVGLEYRKLIIGAMPIDTHPLKGFVVFCSLIPPQNQPECAMLLNSVYEFTFFPPTLSVPGSLDPPQVRVVYSDILEVLAFMERSIERLKCASPPLAQSLLEENAASAAWVLASQFIHLPNVQDKLILRLIIDKLKPAIPNPDTLGEILFSTMKQVGDPKAPTSYYKLFILFSDGLKTLPFTRNQLFEIYQRMIYALEHNPLPSPPEFPNKEMIHLTRALMHLMEHPFEGTLILSTHLEVCANIPSTETLQTRISKLDEVSEKATQKAEVFSQMLTTEKDMSATLARTVQDVATSIATITGNEAAMQKELDAKLSEIELLKQTIASEKADPKYQLAAEEKLTQKHTKEMDEALQKKQADHEVLVTAMSAAHEKLIAEMSTTFKEQHTKLNAAEVSLQKEQENHAITKTQIELLQLNHERGIQKQKDAMDTALANQREVHKGKLAVKQTDLETEQAKNAALQQQINDLTTSTDARIKQVQDAVALEIQDLKRRIRDLEAFNPEVSVLGRGLHSLLS